MAPSALNTVPGEISAMQMSGLTGRYRCRACSHVLRGHVLIACRTSNDFMGQLHAVSGQVLILLCVVHS